MLSLAVFSCLVGVSMQAGLFFANNPDQSNRIDPMTWAKPWFCHENDCPVYTVVDTNSKYETRRYQASQWVQTDITTMLYTEKERSSMFNKLFNYIAGNNSKNESIAMTAPVVTEIVHGAGPDCESNFTMSFMIPHSLQPNPPTPMGAGVRIHNEDPFTIYVKSFTGFDDAQDVKQKNIMELTQDLNNDNKPFNDRVFYTAGYDGPYAFTNRHNEIWVLPK